MAVEQSVERRTSHVRAAGSVQLVGFRLGPEEYGVRITKVQEIILPSEVTRLPQSPDYVKGLIHLRGAVIPIVNLRLRFGLPETETSEETRVIVVNVGNKTLGVVVDSVSEVLRVAPEQIVPPPPAVTGAGREYLTGLVKLENRLLILLDIERLFGAEVGAMTEN